MAHILVMDPAAIEVRPLLAQSEYVDCMTLENLRVSHGGRISLRLAVRFPGDANSSNTVDFTDLGILLNNYNQAGTFASRDFDSSVTVSGLPNVMTPS